MSVWGAPGGSGKQLRFLLEYGVFPILIEYFARARLEAHVLHSLRGGRCSTLFLLPMGRKVEAPHVQRLSLLEKQFEGGVFSV